MTKNQRNILIGVAILLLLYFYFSSTEERESITIVDNGNGNGNGNGKPVITNCTNICCDGTGNPIMLDNSHFPSCKCPQSNFVYDRGQCSLVGVVGCTDTKATNFDPLATIPDPNSCQYGQQTRNCYTNCRANQSYNTINTADACGTGNATNYQLTTATLCASSVITTQTPTTQTPTTTPTIPTTTHVAQQPTTTLTPAVVTTQLPVQPLQQPAQVVNTPLSSSGGNITNVVLPSNPSQAS